MSRVDAMGAPSPEDPQNSDREARSAEKRIGDSRSRGPWKVLSATQHRLGPRTIHVDEIESPDGRRRLTWTYFPGKNAVLTLALDDEENVLLVREYRHPLGREILDLPAGAAKDCHTEDDLRENAARELAEETCFRAREWIKLGSFYPVPGSASALFHCYVARGLEPIPEEERGEGDEWSEIEEVVKIPFRELYRAAVAGEIEDGMVTLAVFWAEARGIVSSG
jgi:ADP-ribose pyrophosphatase